MYGTNLEQVGPNMTKLDQLGQVGHLAVFCLREIASWKSTFDHSFLFPTMFRALLNTVHTEMIYNKKQFEHKLCNVMFM